MKNVTGVCKYCGQFKAIEVPDDYTQEMIDEEVAKNCTCPEATAKAKIEESVTYAEAMIKNMFSDENEDRPDVKDQLLSMARPLAERKIDKVKIDKDNYGFSLYRSSGSIKLDCVHKVKESMETAAL